MWVKSKQKLKQQRDKKLREEPTKGGMLKGGRQRADPAGIEGVPCLKILRALKEARVLPSLTQTIGCKTPKG